MVWHENLSAGDAHAALQYPPLVCRDTLGKLRERGILREDGGRFRVTVAWWPVVVRYLRRKHLIET